jgi:ubiquinone/menaquinone biosynthesis C-methylase UbiE
VICDDDECDIRGDGSRATIDAQDDGVSRGPLGNAPSRMTAPAGVAEARSAQWADPDVAAIDALIADSRTVGWRPALDALASQYPFFAKRMRDIGLGNWHVLLLRPRESAVLDVGCGFGSLVLGLSEYYSRAVGLDALSSRVRYGNLRARQDGRANALFVEGTGLSLPFASGDFRLVTMNGVLEWAGLHGAGRPEDLQCAMLQQVRRVLTHDGVFAMAIENRFAMETLAGMPDTHTGLRMVPALPRRVAQMIVQARSQQDFRTYLYHARGYVDLVRHSGFAQATVLDLVSSYNDYDFVVRLGDTPSYDLLWRRGAVRTFYQRAGSVRRAVARAWPGALGAFGYAYLVIAGNDTTTILDEAHPFWTTAARNGIGPGRTRFACKGTSVGTMVVATHDGTRVESLIEIGVNNRESDALAANLSSHITSSLGLDPQMPRRAAWQMGDVDIRAYGPASAS